MPRYIDADEFIKRVIQYPRQSTKTIGLALADTPTADVVERKKGKWILVTERLPEPNQLVGKTRKYYLIQNEYGDMLTASYNKTALGFIYWEQMYDIEPLHDKVIAWMPLPEPYREEIEDGDC